MEAADGVVAAAVAAVAVQAAKFKPNPPRLRMRRRRLPTRPLCRLLLRYHAILSLAVNAVAVVIAADAMVVTPVNETAALRVRQHNLLNLLQLS